MSQNSVNYTDNPTGPELLDDYLSKEQENILSSNSGIQRPSYATSGTPWIDTSVTPWEYKIYDGSEDAVVGFINNSSHTFTVSNINDSNLVHLTGDETISGIKTFSSSLIVPTPVTTDSSTKAATTAYVKNQGYAQDADVVHLAGAETITGEKTLKNTGATIANPPSNTSWRYTDFVDNNNVRIGVIGSQINPNGWHGTYLQAGNEGSISIFTNEIDVITYAPACDVSNSIVTTINKSKSVNGYFQLGNGLIVQWGSVDSSSGSTSGGYLTFPTYFTTTNYTVCANTSVNKSLGNQVVAEFFDKQTNYCRYNTTYSFDWIAIGY